MLLAASAMSLGPAIWAYSFVFVSCSCAISLGMSNSQAWLERLLDSMAWGGLLTYLCSWLTVLVPRVCPGVTFLLRRSLSCLGATVGQRSSSHADMASDAGLQCNVPLGFCKIVVPFTRRFSIRGHQCSAELPDLQGQPVAGACSQGSGQSGTDSVNTADMHSLQLKTMSPNASGQALSITANATASSAHNGSDASMQILGGYYDDNAEMSASSLNRWGCNIS